MNIIIRHVQAEDYAAVHEIFDNQTVIKGTMRLPYSPLDQTQKRLKVRDGLIQLVAVADNEVVGFSELITYPTHPRHNHVGEINMVTVREGWQGQGIGRQLMTAMIDLADQWLQIRRLGLIVWTDNDNAIQLYRQLGFAVEGTMPEYAYRAGRYIDAHVMGRLSPNHSHVLDQTIWSNHLEMTG